MEAIVRTKLFLFISIFISTFFINAAIVSAADFDDTIQITWEKSKEPYFNKYNPFGAGARAIGMGEAFASIADDASAIYYNPAGLAQLDHNEVFWTGGNYYKNAPYTGFATATLSLGGQYFAVSYFKPYHPIGRYPDEINVPAPGIGPAAGYLFPTQPLTIPPGDYEEWYGDLEPSWQEFLADKYRKYINLPFQENQVMLTYATPLTGDKSFMLGVNVKYLFTDYDTKKIIGSNYDAWAWGLDMGFLYKLRIIEHLKDFNIGIMLRDVSGQIKRYQTGIERNLYFTSTLALSIRTTELIDKEITSFSFDWDAVNDAGSLKSEKSRLKFGFEQWFLGNHFGIRSGLINPMNQMPWRVSMGVSAKYFFGFDYAYVRAIPFDAKAENEDESHWVSVYWHWGQTTKTLPTPDVFASVEPISFSPKSGEVVTYKLSANSKAGIDRWALNVLDKNNTLVKSYVDIGFPPSQIVWNGSDNKYQLLPDGEYTYIFEATDKLGATASTPVQTIKIYTPVLPAKNVTALQQLKRLLKEIQDRDVREDDSINASAKTDLANAKAAKAKPTPEPPPGVPGGYREALSSTVNAMAMPGAMPAAQQGPLNIVGFPNIESGAIRSAYIATDNEGARAFTMDYATENTLPRYVMEEMAMMVRSVAESLGSSVDRIQVNSLYNPDNTMTLSVPAAQAQNFSKGLISTEQMLRGSAITLNGETIFPNF